MNFLLRNNNLSNTYYDDLIFIDIELYEKMLKKLKGIQLEILESFGKEIIDLIYFIEQNYNSIIFILYKILTS